ncbi:MAG: 4Fe-4S dicluster domain-containing protein [Candidatus Lokiarchaeota archaeon]|nr:4Fe-4S dicluster domain-containing protein [Candidatus Lokiarchaeota archaeon]MBD3198940.1 4Fe-4S dicluster domain-containing protein [Candidatus Lokiarchaeota archaeon]
MQVYKLRINRNLCTGCNVCVVSCPINFNQLKTKGELTDKNAVILVRNGVAFPVYEDERKINCDGCGVCLKECPQNAIKLEIIEVE